METMHEAIRCEQSPWRFDLGSVEQLRALATSLSVSLPLADDVACLARPVPVGSLTAPNALAVHPMEGCDGDADGRPGRLTFRRYQRFAAGGAGLIWAEAIAVAPEGRANPRQLWLHEGTVEAFAELVRQTRRAAAEGMGPDHRPLLVAQLTHSGRYSKPAGKPHPLIPQRDPYRDPLVPMATPRTDMPSKLPDDWPPLTDDYLDELQERYVQAALRAFAVGFDAVDIKACHGYLVNELLASRQRAGSYGGSFENRVRFLLEVVEKVRAAVGPDKVIGTRLGVYDAIPYPYGWGVDQDDYRKPDLNEPRQLVALLRERGVQLINVTVGNPYYNPHVGRAYNQPIAEGYPEPEHPLHGVARLIDLAGKLQRAFPDIAMTGTGYSWLRTLMPNVAAAVLQEGGARLVGCGRMAFAYPGFARDICRSGRLDPNRVCVACSACTQLMRDGQVAGCVVRDAAVYGPIYRHGRHSSRENLARLAADCLQCQDATCARACPAHLDIPRFVQQFLDGDDRAAYETIRRDNVLPEVCAWLCPVEAQCQGHCLQHFIGDGALPIAAIQRYLAEQANRQGWSRVRLPVAVTDSRVAVIGGGPTGLACTIGLLEAGHRVTLIDRHEHLGGMIRSVIPPERQGAALASEIEAILGDVPGDRLTLRLGQGLSDTYTLEHVLAEGYDAAFVGLGLPRTVLDRQAPPPGVQGALEFLAAARQNGFDLQGRRVAVIGGGNTAMDAAVSAARLGAQDVYLVYRRSLAEMPAWPAERQRALDAGVHFLILTQQLDYLVDNGHLQGLRVCPTQLGEPDASGRRRPVAQPEQAHTLAADLAVQAIGQESSADLEHMLPGVRMQDGLIVTEAGSACTSRPGVFAGGDLVRGPATVVAAVVDGMQAAREIDRYLRGQGHEQ